MCKGTSCTHHINPAVEYEEEGYDSRLELHDVDMEMAASAIEGEHTGLCYQMVRSQAFTPPGCGVGHINPMFSIKVERGMSVDAASWPVPHRKHDLDDPGKEEEW